MSRRKPRAADPPPQDRPPQDPRPNDLRLPETLDFAQAAPLASGLRAARGQDLAVDAAAVRHLGAQCAQVLLSARRTWAADARAFRIEDPSEAFAAGARLLGLAELTQTDCATAGEAA